MRESTARTGVAPPEAAVVNAYGEMMKQALQRFQHSSDLLTRKYEELRHESEELRARLQVKEQEIERQARMAMLGETAAALAHEVRNPLGAMKLFLSMLRDDLRDNPTSLELISQMEKSVSSLDNLVTNILHFSKSGQCVKSPINIHSILQEVIEMVVPIRDEKIVLTLSLEGSPYILASEHSIRQVFYNLLINALQAMRYRGALHIATRDEPEQLVFTVHDSGPGLAASIGEKLFEPFVTTKPEGTGLGLAIVKKILDQHGAVVRAFNHAEGGAIFEIRFTRG